MATSNQFNQPTQTSAFKCSIAFGCLRIQLSRNESHLLRILYLLPTTVSIWPPRPKASYKSWLSRVSSTYFFQKKHIETIQDISSEKEQPREMHQSPNRFYTKKTSEPTRKHLEKRERQSLLIFFEDIRLVNSLGAKSRAANAQAKRAKSCMDFMWQLQLVRLMPKENTTYYEFMGYSLVVYVIYKIILCA